MKEFNIKEKVLYIIFILSSVLYTAIMFFNAAIPFSYIIKVIPVLCLFLIIIMDTEKTEKLLLGAALLFSGAGDIALGMDVDKFFIPGLVFFLIAHLFYISRFYRNFKFSKKSFPIIIFVLTFAILIGFSLRNIDRIYLIPVIIYLIIITVMVFGACFYSTGHSHRGSALILTGAVLFMISDSIIAINKFIYSFDYSGLPIMMTYYLAQLFIINGFVLKNKFKNS